MAETPRGRWSSRLSSVPPRHASITTTSSSLPLPAPSIASSRNRRSCTVNRMRATTPSVPPPNVAQPTPHRLLRSSSIVSSKGRSPSVKAEQNEKDALLPSASSSSSNFGPVPPRHITSSVDNGSGSGGAKRGGRRVQIHEKWLQQPEVVKKTINELLKSGQLAGSGAVKIYGERLAVATRSVLLDGELMVDVAQRGNIAYSTLGRAVSCVRHRLLGNGDEASCGDEEGVEKEEEMENNEPAEMKPQEFRAGRAKEVKSNYAERSASMCPSLKFNSSRRQGRLSTPRLEPTSSSSASTTRQPPDVKADPLEAKSARVLQWLNTNRHSAGGSSGSSSSKLQSTLVTPWETQANAWKNGKRTNNKTKDPSIVITLSDDDENDGDDTGYSTHTVATTVTKDPNAADNRGRIINKKRKLDQADQSVPPSSPNSQATMENIAGTSTTATTGSPNGSGRSQPPPPKQFPSTPLSVAQLEQELLGVLKPRYHPSAVVGAEAAALAESFAKMISATIHLDHWLEEQCRAKGTTVELLTQAYQFCGHYLDLERVRTRE